MSLQKNFTFVFTFKTSCKVFLSSVLQSWNKYIMELLSIIHFKIILKIFFGVHAWVVTLLQPAGPDRKLQKPNNFPELARTLEAAGGQERDDFIVPLLKLLLYSFHVGAKLTVSLVAFSASPGPDMSRFIFNRRVTPEDDSISKP